MFVVFDFDGTLADTYPLFRQSFDEVASQFDVSPYRVADEAYIRTLEASNVLRFHGIAPDLMGVFVMRLREGMEKRKEQARLFPGVSEILRRLVANGHSLGILSSNSYSLAVSSLGGLIDVFAHREFDVSLRDKAGALTKLRDSKASDGICSIGDEIRDLLAAETAQVPFAAVSWGYNTIASLCSYGLEKVLDQPSDIMKFVETCCEQQRRPGAVGTAQEG